MDEWMMSGSECVPLRYAPFEASPPTMKYELLTGKVGLIAPDAQPANARPRNVPVLIAPQVTLSAHRHGDTEKKSKLTIITIITIQQQEQPTKSTQQTDRRYADREGGRQLG